MNPSSFRRQTTLVKENADEGSPVERKKRRIGDKLKVYQGPHEFLRSSSINDLPCTIENILNKNQRSDEDVAFLYEHVKNYKFLQEIVESSDIKEKHRIISFLCKKFQCEHYEAGNVIIKQGEVSNKKVYLILSGRAQVRIQSNNATKNEEPILKKEDSHKTSSTKTKILTKFSFSKFDLNSKRNSISIENKDSLFFQQAREDFARTPSKYPSSKTRLRTRTESKKTTMNCEDILHQKFDSVLTPITPLAMTPMTLSPLTNFKLEPVDESEFKNAHLYGKVINELIEKDNFGEQALFSQSKRKTTVIAITDLTLITFEQQDYQGAYKEINQVKQDISQSLVKVLPSLNSPENARILDGIVSITDFCDCSYGKKLAIEGEIGDEFFLIVQGQCELIKTVIYDKSERLKGINSLYAFTKTTKEEVIISNVEKGTLIGEEILFGNKGIYKFSVRVNSETAQLITFKKSLFLFRCNKHILKELEEYSSQKNTRNIENLSIRLEKRGTQISTQELNGIKPVVSLPVSIPALYPNSYLTVRTPVKIKPALKIEIQNILVSKVSSPRLLPSLNNYIDMDEKFMSLTSRSCNTTRNQQNGNFKTLFKQESDLRTSRTLTKDISKNIFDTSPHIKASTGNNTPRGANSPEKKQRSSSLLSRNSLRNLFQYQGKEKSKQTFSSILDLIDPKVRRLRKKSQPEISKFDLKKARLGIETKGVLKSARLYSYNSPRVMKGDEQQNLMSFLTSKLTKYKSSLQNLEDCKLQEV